MVYDLCFFEQQKFCSFAVLNTFNATSLFLYSLKNVRNPEVFHIYRRYRNRLMRLICSRRKDHKHYIFHLSWNKKSQEEITQKKRTWVWISIGWPKINKKNQAMAKTAKIMNNIAWNRTLSDFLDQIFWFI